MKRLVVAGTLLGLVNGVVAVLLIHLLLPPAPEDFGWFAYAPASPQVFAVRWSWWPQLLVLPVVLGAVSGALSAILGRRGLLATRQAVD